MNPTPDLATTMALMLGVGWASGINLYAAVLTLGLAGSFGYVDLPPELQIVQHPLVIAAAGLMYLVEFGADKIPGVDSGWDAIHTFIRIPAGALLAAGAVGDVDTSLQVAAGLVGGTFAATTHGAKMGTRALVNTSPEPFSNWALSITEDIAVIGGVLVMLNHPVLFLGLLLLFILLLIWLLPKLWRALRAVVRTIFGKRKGADPAEPAAAGAGSSGEAGTADLSLSERRSDVDERS